MSNNEIELIEKLVLVNRVAKVVKGGRRFGFAALVVVGDGKGRVGFSSGRAKEVADAVVKATQKAQKQMVHISMREGRTLHHDVIGKFGAVKIVMRSAPAGTGLIAGGPARAVFEALGMRDVVAKVVGSCNAYNLVRAVFDGLQKCNSVRHVAERRGKKVSEIVARRGSALERSTNV